MAAVALVAGVVIVLVLLAARHPHKVAGGKTGRTQVTLLFQLRGADGASAGSVLLAHDPTARRGTAVLVPSQVIAEVPGAGSQPFGQALALPGRDLASEALADLMGITVDGSWTLELPTLSTLVDRLGGVTVDVDKDVLAPLPDGLTAIVVGAVGASTSRARPRRRSPRTWPPGSRRPTGCPACRSWSKPCSADYPDQFPPYSPR